MHLSISALIFWLKEMLKINGYSLCFGVYFLFVMVIFDQYPISKDGPDHITNQFPNLEHTNRPISLFLPNWQPDTMVFIQSRETGSGDGYFNLAFDSVARLAFDFWAFGWPNH